MSFTCPVCEQPIENINGCHMIEGDNTATIVHPTCDSKLLYFIVDSYTSEIMDVASTQRLCDEKYDALVNDSGGLFIWGIVRARNRKEAQALIVEANLVDDIAPW